MEYQHATRGKRNYCKAKQSKAKQSLEAHIISLVGTDIYEKLIKGYTQKQWGKSCDKLPSSIIKRIPIRFIYDNNYFNDIFQGIPKGGYTQIFESMLAGAEIKLNADFNLNREYFKKLAKKIIYTGTIDSYFDYKFGELEYRSLRFEDEYLEMDNFQGVAVVNYTDLETPWTRIIEHKHFEFGKQEHTIITREYPIIDASEPYYPINDTKNQEIYEKYKNLSKSEPNIIFGGRLGAYQYYDMQDVIFEALKLAKHELNLKELSWI